VLRTILLSVVGTALVIFTGSHVSSLALPRDRTAYQDRFGFSPHDDDGYDREVDKLRRAVIRYAKDRRAKWYTYHVKVVPES